MPVNVNTATARVAYGLNNLNVNASSEPFLIFDNGNKWYYQADGNLVVYNSNGNPVWAAKSNYGNGDAKKLLLRFQDDGNFVMYYDGNPYFGTDTSGKGKSLVVSDKAPYLMILNGKGNIVWKSQQDE